jgi:hypothetical protein
MKAARRTFSDARRALGHLIPTPLFGYFRQFVNVYVIGVSRQTACPRSLGSSKSGTTSLTAG